MKYPITLKPQGVIPRDPKITVRMQRAPQPVEAQEVVTQEQPPTPPPEADTPDLYRDTMTGFADTDFTDRKPDVGSVYFERDGASPLTAITVDGAGHVLVNENSAARAASTLTAFPSDDYVFEIKVIMPDAGTDNHIITAELYKAPNKRLLKIRFDTFAGGGTSEVEIDNSDGEDLFDGSGDGYNFTPSSAIQTVSLTVSGGNTVVRVNGVIVDTVGIVPDVAPELVAFFFTNGSGDLAHPEVASLIDEIAVYGI